MNFKGQDFKKKLMVNSLLLGIPILPLQGGGFSSELKSNFSPKLDNGDEKEKEKEGNKLVVLFPKIYLTSLCTSGCWMMWLYMPALPMYLVYIQKTTWANKRIIPRWKLPPYHMRVISDFIGLDRRNITNNKTDLLHEIIVSVLHNAIKGIAGGMQWEIYDLIIF